MQTNPLSYGGTPCILHSTSFFQIVESHSIQSLEEESAARAEQIKQKEEMIVCLQDELIKVRLREAENEENIRKLTEKISELEDVS